MHTRTLKRQLSLFQTIMLGTAGGLGSGIFVLTGLAAEVAGPAAVIAILVSGLLSFSIAFNYSELATIYPETGGAMTYVREAWGKGLLSFVVGSMDSISSTFFCALSAVGFAYSLSLFLPAVPIVPTAVLTILVFVILNILGVTNVGNLQVVLGAGLLLAFAVFTGAGFASPAGFQLATLFPGGRVFPGDGLLENLSTLLKTIALIYAAYIGFEVIADDAEEVQHPQKNIPLAILISLGLITLVYTLAGLVTLGTLPWQSVAGSLTALSDAVQVFLPGAGVTIVALAGMVGALTSVNSSMLSATRETFTLGRDGAWPGALARLNRARVPFMAILAVGVISVLITLFGVVDFLGYITSAGYLFVLFFSNLAMIRLRRKHPALHRPYRAPLFPLTPILASLTCLIVICFSDLDALLFTGLVILLFVAYYYLKTRVLAWRETHQRSLSPGRWRILLPLSGHNGMAGSVRLGALLAQAEKDLNLCLLTVLPGSDPDALPDSAAYLEKLHSQSRGLLERFIQYAVERNVPMYTKMTAHRTIADGILHELQQDANVKLVLMRWPKGGRGEETYRKTLRHVLEEGKANLAVLHDHGLERFEQILVPVGGGINCRLAVHLANDIARQEGSHVHYVRVIPLQAGPEDQADALAQLQEIVLTQLGEIPANATLEILPAESVLAALQQLCELNEYGLVLIGATYELSKDSLFGPICEAVVEKLPCSVLVVRRHESATTAWLHHQARRFLRD